MISTEEEQNTTKLLQQYQNIVKQLMAANKKNTIEHFLQNLELDWMKKISFEFVQTLDSANKFQKTTFEIGDP